MQVETTALSFTVPFQIPPHTNRYKQHGYFVGRDGNRHFGYKLSKETRAYYDAVCMFARGESVDPETPEARKRCIYHVEVHVFFGKGQRGDDDGFLKTALDALQYARVIHSDAAVREPRIIVHRDQRDDPNSPRTVYHIERIQKP